MRVIKPNDSIDIRASLGIVKNYFDAVDNIHEPEIDILADVHLDMVRNDPVLSTAMDLTVDVTTANGYSFSGKNKRQIEDAQELFDEILDFDKVIDNVIYQLIIYGNAYMELRRTTGQGIDEIHPLEPTEMAIQYDQHGRVIGYVQKPKGQKVKTEIKFKPEEVIYFRLKWVGSRVYSYSPLESIGRSFTTKILANDYLQALFKHLPPRALHVLKAASREQREAYIANLVRAKRNPNLDLVAIGDADVKLLTPDLGAGLIETLKFLREEVLMVTRVPPIFVGLPDNSNRSSSESMSIPFETRVRKLQHIIASQINRELMPQMGMPGVKFRFNPPSLADEKSIIEIARNMHDMGLDDDTIIEYLKKKGFHTLPETSFKSPEEMTGIKSKDLMPSRVRMNKQTDKMTNNLDEKGVSAEGAEKLETRSVKHNWYIEPKDVEEVIKKNAAS